MSGRDQQSPLKLVVITGRSGSGKTTALKALEDVGFNCIDNLPVRLLSELVEDALAGAEERLAVCIDARNPAADLGRFEEVARSLRHPFIDRRIVYLDAASPTLVKRFSETRRRHPLTDAETTLREAIDQERAVLAPLEDQADLTIDTTALSLLELVNAVKTRVAGEANALLVLFTSFAYRSGVPVDADFVFDARCLPNPHYRDELRDLTGLDEAVREYLAGQPDVEALYTDIYAFLESWIPRFEANQRRYLTVAIGCTGGRHRSVYVADRLAAHFDDSRLTVLVRHRDLDEVVTHGKTSA